MLASQSRIGGHHSPCSTRTRSIARAPGARQQVSIHRFNVVAAVGNGSVDNEDQKKADDLSERILSGEFTDSGSTKEKLTRPVRKLLAQDPVGVGEQAGLAASLLWWCSRHTHAHHTRGMQQPCLAVYDCIKG
jgi:hypothetical protein